jgi:ribosome recycling factor
MPEFCVGILRMKHSQGSGRAPDSGADRHSREYTDHEAASEEEQVMKASDVVDLLNKVEVNCYGTMTPLPQLSTVTIKDDTLVLVRPHDPSQFPALVYAIRNSNAGLNPSDDGKQLLVPVPTSSL